MATVELTIAGRRHELTCRDGEERHLRALAAIVDVKASDAARQMGGMSEARQMLYAALMLADELNDMREEAAHRDAVPAEPDPAIALTIDQLAERLEQLSALIEATRHDDPTDDGDDGDDGVETPGPAS